MNLRSVLFPVQKIIKMCGFMRLTFFSRRKPVIPAKEKHCDMLNSIQQEYKDKQRPTFWCFGRGELYEQQ